MKNIALAGQLSQEIFNGTQKFANELSRSQQFNFREIIRGILLSGSTYLNHIGRANGSSKNERKTISESHEISLSFGNSKTGSLPSRKSLDEINLESVIRLKTKNRFLPYVSIKMQTQFAPGYQYEGTVSKKVSGSMDPVYVTESTGLTRQLFNRLNMRLGLAMKQTFTTHFHVLYTDDPDTPDIEKSKFEFMMKMKNTYE